MKVRKYFYSTLLLLCCWTNYGFAITDAPVPAAKGGIIDLREQSLDNKIALNGEWIFYWQQLIGPGDHSPGIGELVNFPFRWTDKTEKKNYPSFGYATYQLMVLLPKNAHPLRLAMPETYSAYRLFINNQEIAVNGRVAKTAKDFIPYWENKILEIPHHTDTLHILLQIANFSHSRGGIKKPLFIGNKAAVILKNKQAEAIDLLLTGCLIMGGLFFLGLYLMGNRDKAILLFALYSIIYSYRVIGIDNYVLHTILPNLSWYLTVRLEYLSLFLGIGLFALYTRYLYPNEISVIIVVPFRHFVLVFLWL